MIIIHQPLPHQILIVLNVLVQLLELSNLQRQNHTANPHQQQKRVNTPGDNIAQLNIRYEQRRDAVHQNVRNGKGEPKTRHDRRRYVPHDHLQVHVANAVAVHALYGGAQEPFGAHHGDGAGDFGVQDAQGPVLPDEEDGGLVDWDAEGDYDDDFQEDAE